MRPAWEWKREKTNNKSKYASYTKYKKTGRKGCGLFIIISKRTFAAICLFVFGIPLAIGLYSLYASSQAFSEDGSGHAIYINIEEKKLYLYQNKHLLKEYPVATGKPGWPSPIGQWTVVEKSNWGKAYGGYWLGLDVPWGIYGIHGTIKESSIGKEASHGCIRMYNRDIRELYKTVPTGTPVLIEAGPYGPFGAGFRELIPGDRGADVFAVQKRLNELGYFGGQINGIYEDDLKAALNQFQTDHNLSVKHTITLSDYHALGFAEFE